MERGMNGQTVFGETPLCEAAGFEEPLVSALERLEVSSLEQLAGLLVAVPDQVGSATGLTVEELRSKIDTAAANIEPARRKRIEELLTAQPIEYPLGCLDDEGRVD